MENPFPELLTVPQIWRDAWASYITGQPHCVSPLPPAERSRYSIEAFLLREHSLTGCYRAKTDCLLPTDLAFLAQWWSLPPLPSDHAEAQIQKKTDLHSKELRRRPAAGTRVSGPRTFPLHITHCHRCPQQERSSFRQSQPCFQSLRRWSLCHNHAVSSLQVTTRMRPWGPSALGAFLGVWHVPQVVGCVLNTNAIQQWKEWSTAHCRHGWTMR